MLLVDAVGVFAPEPFLEHTLADYGWAEVTCLATTGVLSPGRSRRSRRHGADMSSAAWVISHHQTFPQMPSARLLRAGWLPARP